MRIEPTHVSASVTSSLLGVGAVMYLQIADDHRGGFSFIRQAADTLLINN